LDPSCLSYYYFLSELPQQHPWLDQSCCRYSHDLSRAATYIAMISSELLRVGIKKSA
jgi:hypothetical protein